MLSCTRQSWFSQRLYISRKLIGGVSIVDFQSVMQFIADFGFMAVISAIFVYVIIRLLNILFKHIENKVGVKNHDELLSIRGDISTQIQSLLEEFLERHDGDRLQVVEFSNSVVSVAYLPFKYMTCTYEVYRLGKSAWGHKIDHLSTSLFTPFFMSMQDVPYRIFDVNDKTIPMGGAMHDLVVDQGASKSLCVMLYTPKGKAIGYITMKKESEFTDCDIAEIQLLATSISTLLSVVDK